MRSLKSRSVDFHVRVYISVMKTVSLVLGSGGAQALTQIGIIKWLEGQGYRIISITGSSMGALIGGVYAAGKLEDFEQWVSAITKVDMASLLDLSWEKTGLVKGDKIINSLVELVGDKAIEELPISFTAVAADIKNDKEVWIQSGRLFDAIRASISLPLLFTPFNYNNLTLIDGGVRDPVPIAPTYDDETDMTIAVNNFGKITGEVEKSGARPITEKAPSPLHEKINYFIDKNRESTNENRNIDKSAFDIAIQAFELMQSEIVRQKLASYPPDHILEIPRNVCGYLEFHRAKEMIALGYEEAEKTLGCNQGLL